MELKYEVYAYNKPHYFSLFIEPTYEDIKAYFEEIGEDIPTIEEYEQWDLVIDLEQNQDFIEFMTERYRDNEELYQMIQEEHIF